LFWKLAQQIIVFEFVVWVSKCDKLKDMWADNEACLQHMVRNKKQVIY